MGAIASYEGHSGFLRSVRYDGLLYVPDQRSRLRDALTILGYRVV